MRTWEDYKKDANTIDLSVKQDIEEMEVLAAIVSAIIERRNEIGLSQRELAEICGLPHSSVARIESCSVKPKVETLIKIMKPLNLTLTATDIKQKPKAALLKPIGHCFGVIKAIELAYEVKKKHPDKNIYVFGLLVHNEEVRKELDSSGITTVEISEDIALEQLNKFSKDDVVIFTAHGHPLEYEQVLNSKGVLFYDATCSRVKKCFDQIKRAREVIYIGKKHHPETNAALTMNKNAHLYDINEGFDYSTLTSDSPLVINQTTLSFIELETIHQEIKNKLPRAIFAEEICNATLLRQKAISELDDSVDTLIIVGSKKSSNTMKLYEIAKAKHPNKQIVLINNVDELKQLNLSFKNVVIASGTSTSIETINKIKDYLSSL